MQWFHIGWLPIPDIHNREAGKHASSFYSQFQSTIERCVWQCSQLHSITATDCISFIGRHCVPDYFQLKLDYNNYYHTRINYSVTKEKIESSIDYSWICTALFDMFYVFMDIN